MEALRDVFQSASRAPAVVVSLAAGLTFEQLHAACVPSESRIVRVMPNVAAEVGRSTNGLCVEAGTSPAWVETVRALFSTTGRTVVLANEQAMHGFTAVAGSGPAFVCLFAEALADAAVAEGVPRAQAREIAASMIAGTADLLLESGIGPGPMKDRVTSPAGTTSRSSRTLHRRMAPATAADASVLTDMPSHGRSIRARTSVPPATREP
jgi:pyrroline-5-carboxylate reductase